MPNHPHANLTMLHCALFIGAMLSIAFWGLTVLESDLARTDATIIAER